MKLNDFQALLVALLVHELEDLHSAEKQLTMALPELARAANDEHLKSAFEEHLDVTKKHLLRLKKIFDELGASPRGPTCQAVQELIAEGEDLIEEKDEGNSADLDAALIGAAQRVEHYQIAGYDCARTYAQHLGLDKAAKLLQQTLDEEGQADKKLTEIAESRVN